MRHINPLATTVREGNGTPLQYSCLENPWTEEPGRLQSMGSLRQCDPDEIFLLLRGINCDSLPHVIPLGAFFGTTSSSYVIIQEPLISKAHLPESKTWGKGLAFRVFFSPFREHD